MTIIREASTMYASMFSLILFMILFESRYPKKKTMMLTIGLMGPLMIANFVMLAILGPVVMSTLLLLTCSLPSLIFFWFLSKYRDGRFLFTFCFADTIMLEVIYITSILDFFLGDTYIFMAISRLLLCPAVAFVFQKWIRPTYQTLQRKVTKGWYVFASIALIYYVVMSMAISVPTHITQRLDQLPAFLLLLVLLPFLYIHIFTTLNHQQKAHETMAQENILSVQVSSLLSRVEEFRAANAQFREERHDFRHKMRTIATLASSGEYEKLNATLAEYTSTQQEQPLENYCKFTLLDAVLSSYLQEAKRKSIRVSVKIALPEVLPVNESELATMFANAIENAIHACEKIEPNKRYIEIKTITVPCLMLMVRNSFDGIIAFDEEGIPISQKKEHGFGTRSIVTFCQKNNAFYEFKTEEQDFILKVIFQ